mgnify:CR=1 FL=1|tara:strand:- start:3071 stop:3763 length:693 start_codon:yes stop_codon:yes gene_type:complete
MFSKTDRVLCIAPHADDETLGCGGLISKLNLEKIDTHIFVVTGSGEGEHPIFPLNTWEKVRSEFKLAIKELGNPSFEFSNLPAALLDQIPNYKINQCISDILKSYDPNVILIPFNNDLHNDHKIINNATIIATRPYLGKNEKIKLIVEYETLSETNIYNLDNQNIFFPNFYVDISNTLENKLNAFRKYKSQTQSKNQPRSIEGIKSLARYRGTNINKKYAEAFKILYQKY